MTCSSSTTWKYDVFLNFRGVDTRDGFTSYLYRALCLTGIKVFIDNKLERGKEISPALLQKIESSKMFVVIFSQNYAFSTYCLDELVKIIECKELKGQTVFPVFYKVDPTDIDELKGNYEKAFADHEDKFNEEKHKVEKWKTALQEAVKLSGWHIEDTTKGDAEYIEIIVKTILGELNDEKKETLKRKCLELEGIQAETNSKIKTAETTMNRRQKKSVGIWLKKIGRTKNEAQILHQELEENAWTLQLGVRAERMIEKMSQLIDEKDRLNGAQELDVPQTNVLPTRRLVGQEFERNIDLILGWLLSEEVSIIGIYGMGGVGKTTLMTHVHNKLVEDPHKFPHVYWVTMSQDFSVYELQSLIAKTTQINLGREEDTRKRAAKLSKELSKREKFVLIIDDLWNHFDVVEVGIPMKRNGCKLIVTSRSIEVCRRINCQQVKKVIPLNENEAWHLFIKTFGGKLLHNNETIAKLIARECSGLPLGIVTMAASMRGVDDVHEWTIALMELQRSMVRQKDMMGEVFGILKYSYNRLNDVALQHCLLYCALFPEDHIIPRTELIEYLIAEGIVDEERKTRQEKFSKAHTMLNKLQYVSLLQGNGDYLQMHDLVRDMAVQIMKECQSIIVEPGRQLEEIPDERYWRKDTVRVSLMKNEIREIPSNLSPSCPNLLTLLLSGNHRLVSIADSFFNELHGLKVLDLRDTGVEKLPESISGLKQLTALFISRSLVSYIPTLANLKSLEVFDLLHCLEIRKVPEGLEMLSNLRYLNLCCSCMEMFPPGILPKLYHLEFLAFDVPSRNAEELGGMRRLETLYWSFLTIEDMITYLCLLSMMPRKQIRYRLCVGRSDEEYFDEYTPEEILGHEVLLTRCVIGREVMDTLSLNDMSLEHGSGTGIQNPIGLKSLEILSCYCDGIECLSTSSPFFRSLESLFVCEIKDLNLLLSDSVPHSLNSSFCLRTLQVHCCRSVKKLLSYSLLSSLQNLETIEVTYCFELEELISAEHSSHRLQYGLPNLTRLRLESLPKLKSICSEQIKCDRLQYIGIECCKELEKIPICLPLPLLESATVEPREWWERVKWGQPDQKKFILPGGRSLELWTTKTLYVNTFQHVVAGTGTEIHVSRLSELLRMKRRRLKKNEEPEAAPSKEK